MARYAEDMSDVEFLEKLNRRLSRENTVQKTRILYLEGIIKHLADNGGVQPPEGWEIEHVYRKPKSGVPTRVPRRKIPPGAYDRAKVQAANRNIAWQIGEEEYYRLVSMPCHYCGGKLGDRGVRLDRIESSGSYSTGNVVPCCSRCNMVKNKWLSQKQMEKVGQVLREIE